MKRKKSVQEGRYQMVVKANDLIQRSRFSLSLEQQKIVLYLISKIKPEDEDFQLYAFSIVDFCKTCGINCDGGKNYKELKEKIKAISDKSLWVQLENGKETLLRWIEKPYIDEQNGTIEIKLDKDMKPFLLRLQEKYTQYELIYPLRFKSKYSIRLYEYIMSLHFDKRRPYEWQVGTEDLKRIIGAEEYKNSYDFKRRALNPALAEVNEYSDKILKIEEVKNGRKIIAFKLTIGTKDIIDRVKLLAEAERELDG